jgi:hypothetical protein
MGAIFSSMLRWLAWNAATLIFILALLTGFALVDGELKRSDELRRERAALAAQVDVLMRQLAEMRRSVDERSRRVLSTARGVESILEQKRKERDALRAAHPFARNIPLSEAWQKIQLVEAEIGIYQGVVASEARAKEEWSKGLSALVAQREREQADASRRMGALDAEIDKHFVGRAAAVIRQQLPLALAIFIGILLAPTGIKLFLYYVLAPLAAGRPPIRLLPAAAGSVRASGERPSGVSVPVVLKEHEELLVQPDYLQSTALQARKQTRWLLNGAIPFTSLLSGMYLLTRVAPAGEEPAVVSSTGDTHSEVGVIELGEGAAFVCLPRSLAGVIQDSRQPIRITRHWRLGTLQSWLTLQLRYLVFHGPCKLILKGGRGIRVEAPGAGRLINQAATLGFSANLAYRSTRCETFVSYWRGKEDLFNDLFSGENGVYVYEEVPDPQRTGGVTGRGLQGFFDTLLKLFGV